MKAACFKFKTNGDVSSHKAEWMPNKREKFMGAENQY